MGVISRMTLLCNPFSWTVKLDLSNNEDRSHWNQKRKMGQCFDCDFYCVADFLVVFLDADELANVYHHHCYIRHFGNGYTENLICLRQKLSFLLCVLALSMFLLIISYKIYIRKQCSIFIHTYTSTYNLHTYICHTQEKILASPLIEWKHFECAYLNSWNHHLHLRNIDRHWPRYLFGRITLVDTIRIFCIELSNFGREIVCNVIFWFFSNVADKLNIHSNFVHRFNKSACENNAASFECSVKRNTFL